VGVGPANTPRQLLRLLRLLACDMHGQVVWLGHVLDGCKAAMVFVKAGVVGAYLGHGRMQKWQAAISFFHCLAARGRFCRTPPSACLAYAMGRKRKIQAQAVRDRNRDAPLSVERLEASSPPGQMMDAD
jgi:hypothetical protein